MADLYVCSHGKTSPCEQCRMLAMLALRKAVDPAAPDAIVFPESADDELTDRVLQILGNPGITETTYAKLKVTLADKAYTAPVVSDDEAEQICERFQKQANAEIGQRLADARKFLRLRQETVAEQLCVTRQVISSIETGARPLKATELAVLCNLYRVTPDAILDVKRFGA